MPRIFPTAGALGVLAAMAASCGTEPDHRAETRPPRTAGEVDLRRYQGRWYEIARYPNRFEDGEDYTCMGVTADYTLRPDGRIDVVNTCVKDRLDGETTAADGIAWIAGPTSAQLKVKFAPPWVPFAAGDYWVLALTDDYALALVGDPDGRFLWILSRTPHPPAARVEAMIAAAAARGYDTAPLRFTPHPPR